MSDERFVVVLWQKQGKGREDGMKEVGGVGVEWGGVGVGFLAF